VSGDVSRRSCDAQSLVREAVRLACENPERGEQPFGALVVRHGRVVGTA
jgi:tRNA(Arg) A34 adenosine deaminase TadA